MNAKNSVGVISKETIVSNHPWVTNVQDELERIEEERQEEFNSYFNAFGPVTAITMAKNRDYWKKRFEQLEQAPIKKR